MVYGLLNLRKGIRNFRLIGRAREPLTILNIARVFEILKTLRMKILYR